MEKWGKTRAKTNLEKKKTGRRKKRKKKESGSLMKSNTSKEKGQPTSPDLGRWERNEVRGKS